MESIPYESSPNKFGYLALAREVAAAAAQSTDPDACLRILRSGLIRLGFSRAGVWLVDPDVPGMLQGTWGTGWRGEEVDEHAIHMPFGPNVASEQIVAGTKVVLRRLAYPGASDIPTDRALPVVEGHPNNACLALRVDNRVIGIISVDMLPGEGVIPLHSVAMLELLADIVATAISRARLVTALRVTNHVLTEEIAERGRAEQQIIQRERRHRLLIESTYDVYAVINRDGTIQDISPAVERALGYTVDEMIGRPFAALVHPEDLARHDVDFRRILSRTGQPFYGERRYRTKDRGWRIFEVVGVNYLADPAVNGIIATLRDVTERRELEEQLRQAQKMEAIGRLAGGVAHDFNNLLTVINGYASLLINRLSDQSEDRQAIEQIRLASESAAKLTSQLLAFSRRQIVTPRETDLNGVIEGASQLLRRLVGEDLALEIRLAPDLGVVKVDPGQIEQVLLNLAANARDAMPRGGTLTIETTNVPAGGAASDNAVSGPRVLLAVSDTGLGMDKAVLAHLFEPFFTTKEVGRGTGLGLAAVYGIVKQSGGAITVSSRPGQGTTFRLFFPRVDLATPEESPAGPTDLPRGHETILVVEDEEPVRELVCLVLEESGYRVLAAEGAEQARAIVEQYDGAIHLVLADVVMPGGSGRQLVEDLLAQRPGLRVLYTSGYTDDVVLRHGVRNAEVDFLPKPFGSAELARKVREMLDGERP